MKKIFLTFLFTITFQAQSSLDVLIYEKHASQFSADTDLIYGYILANSNIIEGSRFYGNTTYYYNKNQLHNGNTCSFKDSGNDAMTDLTIQFFPSTGIQLNAQGTCSLSSLNIDIIDLIAGMFNLAKIARTKTSQECNALYDELDAIHSIKIIRHYTVIKNRIKSIQRKLKQLTTQNSPNSTKDIENTKQTLEIQLKSLTKELEQSGNIEALVQDYHNKHPREKLPDYTVEKNLIQKYFNINTNNKDTIKQLIRLATNICNAVKLERNDNDKNYDRFTTYPPFYTNYLISAYAWYILPPEDNILDQLASKINKSKTEEPYTGKLTHKIAEELGRNPSHVPFYPGQRIISNDTITYKDNPFADCTETAIRQFLSFLFSTNVVNSNNEITNQLTVDLNRIPKQATKLREFFAPDGEIKNIRKLANDGHPAIREEFANIVSGHKDNSSKLPVINYDRDNYELSSGWENIIKVVCFLMQGYSADQGGAPTESKRKAEQRIKQINEDVRNGTLNINPKNVIDILNDILGVRTDIKFVAKTSNSTLKQTKTNQIVGKISFTPAINLHNNDTFYKNNTLNFSSVQGHTQLHSIKRNESIINLSDISNSKDNHKWIKQLYLTPDLAIQGEIEQVLTKSFTTYEYPILAFYVHANTASNNILNTITNVITSSNPHEDAIARIMFQNNRKLFINFTANLKDNEEHKQSFIKVFSLVAEHSPNILDAAIALFFLRKNNTDISRFLMDINKNSDIRDLIVQRMIFNRNKEIDPLIEDYVKTKVDHRVHKYIISIAHAILHATQNDDLEMVKYLVEHSINLDNSKNLEEIEKTSMIKAVLDSIQHATTNNKFEMVKYLVNNISIFNKNNIHNKIISDDLCEIFSNSAQTNNFNMIKYLIKIMTNSDKDNIYDEMILKAVINIIPIATQKDNLEMVKSLINNISIINKNHVYNKIISDNLCKIFSNSARTNNFKMIKYLIKIITNSDKNNIYNEMILKAVTNIITTAAQRNNFEMVKYLMEKVKYLEQIVINSDKNTIYKDAIPEAIDSATHNNNFEMVKYLIENNTNFNQPGIYEEFILKGIINAIKTVADNDNLEMVKYLVEKVKYAEKNGISFNKDALYKDTIPSAIKYAVYNDNFEMVKYLVENNEGTDKTLKIDIMSKKLNQYLIDKGFNIEDDTRYTRGLDE